MGQGYVVSEHDVRGRLDEGDTALTKITIDSRHGCERLEQRVIRFGRGRSQPRRAADREELLFVAAGRGVLDLEGCSYTLEPDTDQQVPIAAGSCIHLPPHLVHCLENSGSKSMRVLGVFHPSGDPASRAYDEHTNS